MVLHVFNDILSIILVIVIIYVSHFYYKYFTRENPLPGPIPLPLVGNVSLLFSDIGEWPTQLQKKYGDIYETYIGPQRNIWICREDLVNKMLKPSSRNNFHLRTLPDNDGLKEIGLLDSGIVYNLDYKTWEYYRRFYARSILKSSFLMQVTDSIQAVFREMDDYWEQLDENTELDFSRWAKRYFMDAIFFIAASKRRYSLASYYNSLSINKKVQVSENSLKESEAFIDAVDGFMMCLLYFLVLPKYIFDFPGIRIYTQRLKDKLSWLRKNVSGIIKERREEIEKTPEGQELVHDILTMFLTINTSRDITEKVADSLHDRPMTDEEICGLFLETLSGGIDTSSNTICFIIHFLSRYPKVKERLIEEVDRVVGKDLNHKITYEEIGRLEYCEAVIEECTRLFTTIPMVARRNASPDEIGGLVFPEDTQFYINLQGIHKHKSLWTNPEEFNPDRFMDKGNMDIKDHFHTFGGGLRKCPGRNLAMLELKLTLALLYRKYDIELVHRDAPIKFRTTALRTCHELKVQIKKRNA
ncbi:11684_t:CDS:2 [Acaulospora morrowiae]|uniref:11684_t:CDS:1 n=1 Tax=Acaulospora morrowiae TaxID=94023 RepID=A0A9N8VN48_9GLOM|nr:11684_t:CDS:2 [Acaulospora morrowiae]